VKERKDITPLIGMRLSMQLSALFYLFIASFMQTELLELHGFTVIFTN
jgi:hypothetical protein